jgi:phasin family protein
MKIRPRSTLAIPAPGKEGSPHSNEEFWCVAQKALDFECSIPKIQFVAAHNTAPPLFPLPEHSYKEHVMFAEQFTSVAKANLETQLAAAQFFAAKTFDGVSQLVDLNLQAVKASLEESTTTAQQLLSAKDPREALQMFTALGQPTAAKAVAYTRNLAGIAASTQQELAKATEEQTAARVKEVSALFDQMLKNAPPGMEQAATVFKTAFSNTNAGVEQFNKLGKQAQEAMEANFGKLFAQFSGQAK